MCLKVFVQIPATGWWSRGWRTWQSVPASVCSDDDIKLQLTDRMRLWAHLHSPSHLCTGTQVDRSPVSCTRYINWHMTFPLTHFWTFFSSTTHSEHSCHHFHCLQCKDRGNKKRKGSSVSLDATYLNYFYCWGGRSHGILKPAWRRRTPRLQRPAQTEQDGGG